MSKHIGNHDTALRARIKFTAEAPGGAYKAAAIAALDAVVDLHKPLSPYGYLPVCDHCNDDEGQLAPWPCETVKTVAGALGVEVSRS